MVKWLRHRPFTAVTWVRVPYGSPRRSKVRFAPTSFFAYSFKKRHTRASLLLLSKTQTLHSVCVFVCAAFRRFPFASSIPLAPTMARKRNGNKTPAAWRRQTAHAVGKNPPRRGAKAVSPSGRYNARVTGEAPRTAGAKNRRKRYNVCSGVVETGGLEPPTSCV